MNTLKISSSFFIAIILIACSISKQNTKNTVKKSVITTTVNKNSTDTIVNAKKEAVPTFGFFNFELPKPIQGIFAPRNEELLAIQSQYKDVTLEQLKEGHAIYTQGVCINCHTAQSIYTFNETQWKSILDDMALKADISSTQKDAVHKYILSIKATQPK